MWGPEAAALSGIGHLLFFTGTDTLPAIDLIEEYYNGKIENDEFRYNTLDGYLIAGSVAATEHMVMTMGGQEGEPNTYRRLITNQPNGIMSIVSDTWNLWNVATNILVELKDLIMSRNGKIVIRPDSGDPVKIICGDPDAPVGSPEYKGLVECLWDVFGGTYTDTGHKVLDSHIGVIYGDSITEERLQGILTGLFNKGFASANMVFGIGSFTYTYVTRDTYGWAMKATWAKIDGQGVDMFKKPITDNGVKNSAKGRLAVLRDRATGELYLVEGATPEQEAQSILRPIFENGEFLVYEDYKTIRERARQEGGV
jgi:nicotinamide phosphoribosyltransferase